MFSKALYFLGYDRLQQLLEKRAFYLTEDLAYEAIVSGKGYASVDIPLFFRLAIQRPITQMTVITDPKLAKELIKQLSDEEPLSRVPYLGFDKLLGTSTLPARFGEGVHETRNGLKKKFLKNTHSLEEILHDEIKKWHLNAKENAVNLKESLNKHIMIVLARLLLGLNTFPPEDVGSLISLNGLLTVLEKLDIAVQSGDLQTGLILSKELSIYSKWLYEHNKGSLSEQETIVPYILNPGHSLESSNLAATLLVTTNLSRLIYLSALFFTTHPFWQELLQKALLQKEEDHLTNLYEECCRLFITTIIPRYSSHSIKVGEHDFPQGTLFEFLVRKMRMDPNVFIDPLTFNPNRYQENKSNVNQTNIYSPFGFGKRRCPAESEFSKAFWIHAMHALFSEHSLSLVNDEEMEEIPVDIPYISLKKIYLVNNTPNASLLKSHYFSRLYQKDSHETLLKLFKQQLVLARNRDELTQVVQDFIASLNYERLNVTPNHLGLFHNADPIDDFKSLVREEARNKNLDEQTTISLLEVFKPKTIVHVTCIRNIEREKGRIPLLSSLNPY